MNRRTLVKLSSLFAVSSIFSVSISAIKSGRVNAQPQFRRVDSSSSSCARAIDKVIYDYKLRVTSFDFKFIDRSGNGYVYAFSGSTKALKKSDEQPDAVLSSTSLNQSPSSDDSKVAVAQGLSLAERVNNDIENAMTKEGVSLFSVQFSAFDRSGRPCKYNVYNGTTTYGAAPR